MEPVAKTTASFLMLLTFGNGCASSQLPPSPLVSQRTYEHHEAHAPAEPTEAHQHGPMIDPAELLFGESDVVADTWPEAPRCAVEPTTTEEQTAVTLFNVHTDETLVLSVSREGHVSEDMESVVEDFFKCRRSRRAHTIEPGVLRVLAAIARQHPGRVIEIVSGYRTAPYGVKDSKHYQGRAIDLRVRGVKLTSVRDWVWRHFADVGVGYYGHQNFIHVDYRPDEKDTAWTSPHENAQYEYNPRWAMRIRPPWREPETTQEI